MLIEIGEGERQRKEGGGQRKGSHTQEERREATRCRGVQNSERRGERSHTDRRRNKRGRERAEKDESSWAQLHIK